MSINFGKTAIISAYRYLSYEVNKKAAENFDTCLQQLVSDSSDTAKEKIKADLKSLINLSDFLQPVNIVNRDLNLNPTIRSLRNDGIELIQQIKDANKTPVNLASLVQKIKKVAKESFQNPASVSRILTDEAQKQQKRVSFAIICAGLVGIYELVMVRDRSLKPQSLIKTVESLAKPLQKMIQSFAERGGVSEAEGIEMLKMLASRIKENQDQLKPLYPPHSYTAKMVQLLSELTEYNLFYNQLKQASIQHCYDLGICSSKDTVTENHLNNLFQEQAKILADSLPDDLKPRSSKIANQIAEGFKFQQNHGQGALVHGQQSLNMDASQFFGDGIIDDPTFIPVDPFNFESLAQVQNQKAQEQAAKLGEEFAHDYYHNRTLPI